MKEKKALAVIRKDHERTEKGRLGMQGMSSQAQRLAKQAIFALHRDDLKSAERELKEAEALLKKCGVIAKKDAKLGCEGAWRAALEEYCEARYFQSFIKDSTPFRANEITKESSILLGALSDLVGELVRLAVKEATDGNVRKVAVIHRTAEDIVSFILSMDLTGTLRTKSDQARQHLRRLEDVRYDLSKRD